MIHGPDIPALLPFDLHLTSSHCVTGGPCVCSSNPGIRVSASARRTLYTTCVIGTLFVGGCNDSLASAIST